jgi:hypothetical protein
MENEDIKYDGSAIVIINESDSVYEEAKPREINAHEISAILRYDKRRQKELTELKGKLDTVRDYLLENYEELGEHAQEIADLLDIELTKEVSVTVTVEFEVQLSLKPDEDLDDIIMGLEYTIDRTDEVTDYYTGDVTWQES